MKGGFQFIETAVGLILAPCWRMKEWVDTVDDTLRMIAIVGITYLNYLFLQFICFAEKGEKKDRTCYPKKVSCWNHSFICMLV